MKKDITRCKYCMKEIPVKKGRLISHFQNNEISCCSGSGTPAGTYRGKKKPAPGGSLYQWHYYFLENPQAVPCAGDIAFILSEVRRRLAGAEQAARSARNPW